MFQAITEKDGPRLPSVYFHDSMTSDIDLNTAIKLCLTDSSFPAFVGLVEKELDKIKKEWRHQLCVPRGSVSRVAPALLFLLFYF